MIVSIDGTMFNVLHVSCVAIREFTNLNGDFTAPCVEHYGLIVRDGKLTTVSLEGVEFVS